MERVMQEYKQGELRSGRIKKARKVKRRKQAIAIALHEAGLSKFDTRAERKRIVAGLKRKVKVKRAKRKVAKALVARRAMRSMGGKNATARALVRKSVRKAARKSVRRRRVARAVRRMRSNGMGD
jgi:hypothetical protein